MGDDIGKKLLEQVAGSRLRVVPPKEIVRRLTKRTDPLVQTLNTFRGQLNKGDKIWRMVDAAGRLENVGSRTQVKILELPNGVTLVIDLLYGKKVAVRYNDIVFPD